MKNSLFQRLCGAKMRRFLTELLVVAIIFGTSACVGQKAEGNDLFTVEQESSHHALQTANEATALAGSRMSEPLAGAMLTVKTTKKANSLVLAQHTILVAQNPQLISPNESEAEMNINGLYQGTSTVTAAKNDTMGSVNEMSFHIVQNNNGTATMTINENIVEGTYNPETHEFYMEYGFVWRLTFTPVGDTITAKGTLTSNETGEGYTQEITLDLKRIGDNEVSSNPTQEPNETTNDDDGPYAVMPGNILEGGRDVEAALTRLHEWSMSYNWTPEEIKEANDSTSIVKIGDLSGEVWILPAGAQDMDECIFAELDTPLHHGDIIITTGHGGVTLSFSDMSSLEMKPGAIAQLDIKSERKSKIGLVAGTAWVNLKKMVTGGSMEVEMSQGVCGIKGTILAASVTDAGDEVYLFTSSADVTSKENGETVTLKPGQKALINPAGDMQVDEFDIAEQAKAFDIPMPVLEADGYISSQGRGLVWILLILAVVILSIIIMLLLRNNRRRAKPAQLAAGITADPYGQPIPPSPQTMYCPNCGKPINEGQRFCQYCGKNKS
ncbi:MAG TPA: zinc ribbon domain-containing protein [Clostridiales bacterium]|nr:zinc ribbon domain-containing protein [Clostridiales bacterium]